MNYFITLRRYETFDGDDSPVRLIHVDPSRIVKMARPGEFVTWLFFGGGDSEPVVETPEEIDVLINDMMIRRHYKRLDTGRPGPQDTHQAAPVGYDN